MKKKIKKKDPTGLEEHGSEDLAERLKKNTRDIKPNGEEDESN